MRDWFAQFGECHGGGTLSQVLRIEPQTLTTNLPRPLAGRVGLVVAITGKAQ